MLRCPQCQLTYVDPTLRYCLEDGTALISDTVSATDKTLVMDESSAEPPPTEILDFGPAPTVRAYDDEATALRGKPAATARQQARPTINEFQDAAAPTPLPRKTTSVVAVTVVATILVLAVGGFGAWLLMRDKGASGGNTNTRTDNGGNLNVSTNTNDNGPGSRNGNANIIVSLTPTPTATPMSTPSATPQATATPNNPSARTEVLNALNGWTETMKRADLNGHMAYYAGTLHTYYNARNYNVSGVRANVARAFAKYSSFDVRLTNIQIDVDPSGTSAVATFTKSFVFSGSGTYSGSGVNRFWFEKIGGRWLITGEKDYG